MERGNSSNQPNTSSTSRTPGGEKKDDGIFDFRPENFILGTSWGLISGYTSGVFFLPPPDKWKLFGWSGHYSKHRIVRFFAKKKLIYPTIMAARMLRRGILAGLVFDTAERRAAHNLKLDHSPSSTLCGLLALTLFFKVSNDIRDHIIASCALLGSYVLGAQLAKFTHRRKLANTNSDNSRDTRDN